MAGVSDTVLTHADLMNINYVRIVWRVDCYITQRCSILWPVLGLLYTREKRPEQL